LVGQSAARYADTICKLSALISAGVQMTPDEVDEAFNKGDFFNTVSVSEVQVEKWILL